MLRCSLARWWVMMSLRDESFDSFENCVESARACISLWWRETTDVRRGNGLSICWLLVDVCRDHMVTVQEHVIVVITVHSVRVYWRCVLFWCLAEVFVLETVERRVLFEFTTRSESVDRCVLRPEKDEYIFEGLAH